MPWQSAAATPDFDFESEWNTEFFVPSEVPKSVVESAFSCCRTWCEDCWSVLDLAREEHLLPTESAVAAVTQVPAPVVAAPADLAHNLMHKIAANMRNKFAFSEEDLDMLLRYIDSVVHEALQLLPAHGLHYGVAGAFHAGGAEVVGQVVLLKQKPGCEMGPAATDAALL